VKKLSKVFLNSSEKEKNAVAVHCKAGLGRTGSLIACYAMKHHRFPADAFIGYIRICRPGSILGPQQQFLNDIQDYYFKKGEKFRQENNQSDDLCLSLDYLSLSTKSSSKSSNLSSQSKKDQEIARNGDIGQGEGLMDKKYKK